MNNPLFTHFEKDLSILMVSKKWGPCQVSSQKKTHQYDESFLVTLPGIEPGFKA